MVQEILRKGRQVFMWLASFVQQHGWNTPHTRLVLFDIYVRSVLQYGCPVWAPQLLLHPMGTEVPALRPLLV